MSRRVVPFFVCLLACTPAPAIDASLVLDAARTETDAGRDAGTDAAPAVDASAPDASAPDSAADAAAEGTTVRIVYPAGHAITLRGSGAPLSGTGTAVTELGSGMYEIRLHDLAGPIEFKPLLDDTTWAHGPNFHLAPGQAIEIAPHFTASSGRVTTLIPAWSSTLLGNTRAVYAYLPAAYDENTAARFPVLYMHDGQNLFDPALAFGGNEWRVDETANAAGEGGLCANGEACGNDGDCATGSCETFGDTIIIGVANTSHRIGEYTPTMDSSTPGGGDGELYLQALVSELMPMVDTMLRTRTGPADTAILGSSLGGLISAHAGVVRPETFGRIGAMSPSTWWDDTEIISEVETIPSHATRALRVYVDSGNAGASMDDVTNTASLAMAYRADGYVEGIDFHYVVQAGGQHSEIYWAQRLPSALLFLLAPRERPRAP